MLAVHAKIESQMGQFHRRQKLAKMTDDEVVASWFICTCWDETDPWFLAVEEELSKRGIAFGGG
jgi:hypothetical protein